MSLRFEQIKRYVSYYGRSVNRHGAHSPFVYDLIEKVLRDRSTLELDEIESIWDELRADSTALVIEDLGAGSVSGMGKRRKIKDIAKYSVSSKRQSEVLFKLVRHFKINQVLEFGTCLGISAAYMSKAGAHVISMEGSRALHGKAKESFGPLGLGIDFRIGSFDDLLPGVLKEIFSLDMAFIDGNHTEEATLRYFKTLLPYMHDDSILIFDDIHWSSGMERAWGQIMNNDRVTLSLDLFWCGMVFFRPGLSGEHFTIRY